MTWNRAWPVDVDGQVAVVLGKRGLHHDENRVLGAYLDVAEAFAADAVDVEAEQPGVFA
mgnify:CR=1 FL=1